MSNVLDRILRVVACGLLISASFADDGGGGSISGTGDNSGLGSFGFGGNNGSSLSSGSGFGVNNGGNLSGGSTGNSSSGSSFSVPPIMGLAGSGSGNGGQLNLNNQTSNLDQYSSTGVQLQNGSNNYRNINSTGYAQNYANINGRASSGGMDNSMAYVPSVLGTGTVQNPVTSQNLFQKNVQIRSGLFLPIFAYNLFQAPNTFAPISSTPVDANYTLGPDDQINLKAWGSMNVDYTTPVSKDGTIFIPKVGKISVVGIKASSLDSYLSGKMNRIYRNFSLSATVSQLRSISVNVAGYAARPGTYQLSALSSLSNAVFTVGGPALSGSLRNVEIKRNGQVVSIFDMYDIILRGDNSKDLRLLPGDTIYFAPKGNEAAIYEGIKVPGIYEMRNYETVADIVAFAGGFNYNTSNDKLVVEQLLNHQAIIVKDCPLDKGMRKILENGDVVHLFSLNNVYESSIVLMGNVAEPSRYEYKSGMRISDIIKDKKMLLTKSFWNSYAYNSAGRDNVLTQTGQEKTTTQANSDNTSMYSTGMNSNGTSNSGSKIFSAADNLFIAGPVQIPEADINWNYATIIRINKQSLSTNVIPFNLRKALQKESDNDLQLQAGDIIDILSAKDVRTASSISTVYVFVDGEVNAPGVYEMKPGQTIIDVIKKADGLSSSAYLYGTELNRESVRKKQQVVISQMADQLQQSLLAQAANATTSLTSQGSSTQSQILAQQQAYIDKIRQIRPSGRVVLGLSSFKLDLEHLPALVVENGDTLYIPKVPTTIDIVGQVYNPATFMFKPNVTVAKYIDMAGTENKFADTSSEYILCADGTIYSRQQAGWFGGFANRTLSPGDAVIVPQQVQFGSGMQLLINLSQILANTAQTVALFNNRN